MVQVDADKDYMNKLYGIEHSFWQHVEKDKEPEDLDTSELPKLAGKIKINDMRSIDFDETGNNEFLSNASKWIETKVVADENKALGVILKGSVPDDCRKATGGGVIITRNKAGNLISQTKPKEDVMGKPLDDRVKKILKELGLDPKQCLWDCHGTRLCITDTLNKLELKIRLNMILQR